MESIALLFPPAGEIHPYEFSTFLKVASAEPRRSTGSSVRLSYSLRNRWDVLHFKNYPEDDMGELVNAVDEVISEMLKYIRHSFMRFDLDRQ